MTSEDFIAHFDKMLRLMESELSLPAYFLDKIAREDDWSFIIKVHALIEAAVTSQLSLNLDARLRTVFEKIELSNSQTGKVVFAEAMGLLDSKHRRFIRRLSEIRNSVVHDIKKVSFNLQDYFKELDPNQRKSFTEALTSFADTPSVADSWKPLVETEPKIVIMIGTIILLWKCITDVRQAQYEQKSTNLAIEFAHSVEQLLSSHVSASDQIQAQQYNTADRYRSG